MKCIIVAFALGMVFAEISAMPTEEGEMVPLAGANTELDRQKKSLYDNYEFMAAPTYNVPSYAPTPAKPAKAPAKAPAYAPAPVYAASEPVYAASAPVYAASAPVYAASAPVYAASAPVYAASAPVYAASAPVYAASAPAAYTHHAPPPTVPCAKNVLVSCAPTATPVGCPPPPHGHHASAPSYGY